MNSSAVPGYSEILACLHHHHHRSVSVSLLHIRFMDHDLQSKGAALQRRQQRQRQRQRRAKSKHANLPRNRIEGRFIYMYHVYTYIYINGLLQLPVNARHVCQEILCSGCESERRKSPPRATWDGLDLGGLACLVYCDLPFKERSTNN